MTAPPSALVALLAALPLGASRPCPPAAGAGAAARAEPRGLQAAPQTDAAAGLAERLGRVEAARYRAELARTWKVELVRWEASGDVLVSRAAPGRPARFLVEARVVAPGGSARPAAAPAGTAAGARVALLRDGARWRFLHRDENWSVEGDGAHIAGPWSECAAALALGCLLDEQPFAAGAPEGAALADLGASSFAGEPCRELERRAEREWSRWTLTTRDALPRLCERELAVDAVESIVEHLRVLSIEPGPVPAPEAFVLALPPGCEVRAPEPRPAPAEQAAPAVTTLASSTEPVRRAFEAERGRVRVIGLFAPT